MTIRPRMVVKYTSDWTFSKIPFFDAFLKPHFDVGHMGGGQGTGNRFRPNYLSRGQGTAELNEMVQYPVFGANTSRRSITRAVRSSAPQLPGWFCTFSPQLLPILFSTASFLQSALATSVIEAPAFRKKHQLSAASVPILSLCGRLN